MTEFLRPVRTIRATDDKPLSLAELIAQLTADERGNGTADGPRFLYRGQTRRHIRSWPPESVHGLSKHQFQFDSLIPTDYRGLEDNINHGSSRTLLLETYGDDVAIARLCKTWTALVRLVKRHAAFDAPVRDWAKRYVDQPARVWCDISGSVGQHYGLRTGFLDASSSLHVGLFFASFDFNSGTVAKGKVATLYRIDRELLLRAETAANTRDRRTGAFACRHVDIRGIPAQIAQRPSLQHGWSLINFESPLLQAYLLDLEGIVAFEFITDEDTCIPSREQVMPSGDPLLAVFDSFEQDDCWITECQDFVDQLTAWRGLSKPVNVRALHENANL